MGSYTPCGRARLYTMSSSGLLPLRRYSTSLTSNSVALASRVAVVMGRYPPWGRATLARMEPRQNPAATALRVRYFSRELSLIVFALRGWLAGRGRPGLGAARVVLTGHALLDEVGASFSGQHRMVSAELAGFHLLLRGDCKARRARQNRERKD